MAVEDDKSVGSTYAKAYNAPSSGAPDQGRFKLKILSPYETYFTGEAVSLSAANVDGPFDVLAGHTNFFTLVDGGTIKVNTGFQQLEFQISRGILRVNTQGATLFANI